MIKSISGLWDRYVHSYNTLATKHLLAAQIELLREEDELDERRARVEALRDKIGRLAPIVEMSRREVK